MAKYETCETIRDGHVAELRLTRPDLHNRFDDLLHRELVDALRELADDPGVRAVVWTSEGRHFSAGGDTASMLAGNEDLVQLLRQVDDGRRLYRAFADFSKPVVLALHGHVFGIGTSLAFLADAIVATPEARIVDPHVHMGLVTGDGGVVGFPGNMPFLRAKRHLLWGEPLTGAEAHELGLVTELADSPEAVREAAFRLAQEVASLPPIAVQLTKRALNKALHARIDDVFDTAFYLEALSATTDDIREAVAAFKEKRPGNWAGR